MLVQGLSGFLEHVMELVGARESDQRDRESGEVVILFLVITLEIHLLSELRNVDTDIVLVMRGRNGLVDRSKTEVGSATLRFYNLLPRHPSQDLSIVWVSPLAIGHSPIKTA